MECNKHKNWKRERENTISLMTKTTKKLKTILKGQLNGQV